MNFGWPLFEGLERAQRGYTGYASKLTLNYYAPNPLYQVNGCNQQYFYFQNLTKQETANGTATFLNPCNPTQTIPSSIPTFEHSRPIIDWRHGAAGPSRTVHLMEKRQRWQILGQRAHLYLVPSLEEILPRAASFIRVLIFQLPTKTPIFLEIMPQNG